MKKPSVFIRGLKRNVHDKLKCHQLCGICFVAHNEEDLKSNHTQTVWIYGTTAIHHFSVCVCVNLIHDFYISVHFRLTAFVTFLLQWIFLRLVLFLKDMFPYRVLLKIFLTHEPKIKFNLHTMTFRDNMPHVVTLETCYWHARLISWL